MKKENFLSIVEMAIILKKHPNTIRNAIKNGIIRAVRIGQSRSASYRIPESEIERMMEFDLLEVVEKKKNKG